MMQRQEVILGIDVGGTRIRMGLVDRSGDLIDAHAELIADKDRNSFITTMFQMVRTFMSNHETDCNVTAITVGVPSTLNKDRSIVLSTPNIAALNNIPLKRMIEEAFGIQAFVERDVNFILYHDCEDMDIPDDDIVMACYIGTGIGNAVRINGHLLTGKNGVACELGHIPVAGNHQLCVCGKRGCIETVASGKQLASLCDDMYPGEPIHEVFLHHTEDLEIRQFIQMMALPIATEVNLLDPDDVIIGGGVPAMPGFPKKFFEDCLLQHVRQPYPAQNLNILYADDDPFSGVMGGASYAFRKLGDL